MATPCRASPCCCARSTRALAKLSWDKTQKCMYVKSHRKYKTNPSFFPWCLDRHYHRTHLKKKNGHHLWRLRWYGSHRGLELSCTSSARTSSDASTSDLPSATSAASSPVRVTPALKTYRKNISKLPLTFKKNTSSNLSSNSPFEKHHETSTIETFSRLQYVTLPKMNITPDK